VGRGTFDVYVLYIYNTYTDKFRRVVRAMAVNDLWSVRVTQVQDGQDCLNQYFYRELSTPSSTPAWLALAVAFNGTVIPSLQLVQSTDLGYTNVDFFNLDDPTEFGTATTTAVGLVASEALPPFVAWSFRLNRITRAVRNGYKRIPGVPESFQANGTATTAAIVLLTNSAAILAGTLTESGGSGVWKPQVVRRLPGPPPTHTPFDFGLCQYLAITSQVSRKVGRGI